MFRSLVFSACLLIGSSLLRADDAANNPNLLPGDFESGTTTYNPWAGVDDQGNIQVITGTQVAVDDSGTIGPQTFSPSVSVGDLNGDGLPDLVVGDARGFLWYFPNSGKVNAPVFTHGEIIPIWLGGGEHEADAVPRLQVVDVTGDNKPSIVAGNYFGGLYYIINRGSASSPSFRMPASGSRDDFRIPTRTKDLLWCNYLAPFLYDWSGSKRLDLLIGEGSYSANSIFLFKNQGTNDRPVFNEKAMQKIIPGMGREDLIPQVVDWNNDGKPDILTSERQGYVNVYLNQAEDKTGEPVFDKDKPIRVMFDTAEQVSQFATVCAGNLLHDTTFDLVVGSQDGHISIASNIGKTGAPKFGALTPLKGTNSFPKIIAPQNWGIDRYRPDGAAYELLECTNTAVEPGFVPPPDPFKGKGALKFSIFKNNNIYFKDNYQPAITTDRLRYINYGPSINIEPEKPYTLRVWVRADGDISNLTWHVRGNQGLDGGGGVGSGFYEHSGTDTGSTLGVNSAWSQVDTTLRIPKVVKDNPERKRESGNFTFSFTWEGDGTLYLDDISLKKAQ